MKNVWMLLLLVGVLFLVGCDDMKPDNWDITEKEWEEWGDGIVVNKKTIRGPDCDHDIDAEGDWCNTNYQITLDDGNIFNCGNIKNQGTVRIGEKGKLYKRNIGSRDKVSWFQWVRDVNYTPEAKPASASVYRPREEKDFPIEEDSRRIAPVSSLRPYIPGPATVYQWKDADVIKPKINTTVLVRRNDGIITTGYVLSNGSWKYDLFRYKTGGGLTATEIEEWKEVDIH